MYSDHEEKFEWNGRLCTVKELANIAGINERTMSRRLDRYKTMEAVMAVEPLRNAKAQELGSKNKALFTRL